MKTTSLIIEFVIIGFQVIIWIILALISIWEYKSFNFDILKDWTAPLTLATIGVSYTFGIMFDSFTASLFAPWSYQSKKVFWLKRTFPESPSKMRAHIMINHPEAYKDVELKYNQNRLLRSSILNIFLICFFAIYYYLKTYGISPLKIAVILVLSGSFILITVTSWYSTLKGYYFNLTHIYESAMESRE